MTLLITTFIPSTRHLSLQPLQQVIHDNVYDQCIVAVSSNCLLIVELKGLMLVILISAFV